MRAPPSAEFWTLSAAELAEAYRAAVVTPDEVLASILVRIDKVNPAINAIVMLDRDGAVAQALASTERFRAEFVKLVRMDIFSKWLNGLKLPKTGIKPSV